MNTEERHQLQSNELGHWIQGFGHRLEEHASKIVLAICAFLIIGGGITWWSRQVSSTTVSAWTLLESARSIDDFSTVADEEKYKNTPASRWAKLRVAEMYLQTGMSTTFTNRELALSDLKHAKEGFEQLLGEKVDLIIRERALWGLALTLETISDGDTTKALEAYKQLLNDVPDTIYKLIAEQRVTDLKTGGAKEFYSWFSKQNPKPEESRPKDGMIRNDPASSLPFANDFSPNPPSTDDKSDKGAPQKPPVAPPENSKEPATTESPNNETKSEEKPSPDSAPPPKSDASDPKDPGSNN